MQYSGSTLFYSRPKNVIWLVQTDEMEKDTKGHLKMQN